MLRCHLGPERVVLMDADGLASGDAGIRTREGAQHPLTAYRTKDEPPTSHNGEARGESE